MPALVLLLAALAFYIAPVKNELAGCNRRQKRKDSHHLRSNACNFYKTIDFKLRDAKAAILHNSYDLII
jgi:hypothetical protein